MVLTHLIEFSFWVGADSATSSSVDEIGGFSSLPPFFAFLGAGGNTSSITTFAGISSASNSTGSISYLTINPPSTTILAPITKLTGLTETTYLINGNPLQ